MSPEIPPAPRPPVDTGPEREPDDRWQQWIAEQCLRGCTKESMIQSMESAGFRKDLAARSIEAARQHPYFRAAERMQQLALKLGSVMGNLQRLRESAPGCSVVEKRPMPARAEFLERYVYGCRPLVLTDVARDWPALQRWSPEDLKRRFGHLEVEIQCERERDPRYEINKLAHRRRIGLAQFVDQVLAGGESNDYYLTANNESLRDAGMAPLLGDIGTLPDICDRARLEAQSWFWFGPAGTVTPLHHDTLMLFHTQVVGRKRWRFISPLATPRLYNHYDVYSPIDLDAPDLARYPEFAGVQVLEAVLEPGETVFLPLGWWHQVRALETSMSFSFSNLSVPNEFSFANPSIADW